MTLATWAPDWVLAGLRITRTGSGAVEFDLVYRSRGHAQYVQPIASIMSHWTVLSEDRQDYIERCLVEAARAMIHQMLED